MSMIGKTLAHYEITSQLGKGGTRLLWNRNGRELFYYVVPGTIVAVPIEPGPVFKAGKPQVVFKGNYLSPQTGLHYSVTPDGKRFLMIQGAQSAGKKATSAAPRQKINLVLNWLEELKQRVSVK
jgi:hypothetical protein